MATQITLEQLTKQFNDDINALSTVLYESKDITREVKFNVVEHAQDYFDNKKYTPDVITPGLAKRITGAYAPSQTYKSYNDSIVILFYGFYYDKNDLDIIMNEYAQIFTGKSIKTDDWTYSADFFLPTFGERTEDEGQYRIQFSFEINYNFTFKGYMSDDITLEIDDETVSFTYYGQRKDKNGPSSDGKNDANKVSTIFDKFNTSKNFKARHIESVALNKIVGDVIKDDFLNRIYKIHYAVGTITDTRNMLLSSGDVSVTEGQYQLIDVNFIDYKDVD